MMASAPSTASPTLAKYWIETWINGMSPSCENRWKGKMPARYSHQCSRGVSSNAAIRMAFGAQNTDTGADGNASTSPTSAAMKYAAPTARGTVQDLAPQTNRQSLRIHTRFDANAAGTKPISKSAPAIVTRISC